jgi:hypothetical protein
VHGQARDLGADRSGRDRASGDGDRRLELPLFVDAWRQRHVRARVGRLTSRRAGFAQVLGVGVIVRVAVLRTVPTAAVIPRWTVVLLVAVRTAAEPEVFPAGTVTDLGTVTPEDPVSVTASGLAVAQVSDAVTSDGAPPGTEAGVAVIARSAG